MLSHAEAVGAVCALQRPAALPWLPHLHRVQSATPTQPKLPNDGAVRDLKLVGPLEDANHPSDAPGETQIPRPDIEQKRLFCICFC